MEKTQESHFQKWKSSRILRICSVICYWHKQQQQKRSPVWLFGFCSVLFKKKENKKSSPSSAPSLHTHTQRHMHTHRGRAPEAQAWQPRSPDCKETWGTSHCCSQFSFSNEAANGALREINRESQNTRTPQRTMATGGFPILLFACLFPDRCCHPSDNLQHSQKETFFKSTWCFFCQGLRTSVAMDNLSRQRRNHLHLRFSKNPSQKMNLALPLLWFFGGFFSFP